jgi:hypothetical protein
MDRQIKSRYAFTVGRILMMVSMIGIPVMAEDPPEGTQGEPSSQEEAKQASQEQPVLKSSSSSKQANSLAEAASRIRLQKPAGERSSGLVITNDNLKQTGAKASVSVAGGGEQSSATQSAGSTTQATSAGTGNPANALVQQYHAQKRNVDLLEERLASYDEQLKQPNRDPHYADYHTSPQNRAPGVQDNAQMKRDNTAKELAQEKQKLEALRRQAVDAGVSLD